MTSSNLNKNGSHDNLTNSMQDKTRNRPKPLPYNTRQALGVSHLPTPSPTPKSPCFVHSNLNQSFSLSEIINNCDDKLTEYSNLAETAVSVRELSKKLGQAQIQSGMQTVMIVTKPGNLRLVNLTRELAMYLITTPRFGKDHGVTVYVDKALKDVKRFNFQGMLEETPFAKDYLKFWTKELCAERPEIFNFVLTLGGDGTVLYTSWLFQKVVPPVLPFHLGSLGFLTNFDIQNYEHHLTNAMEKGIRVNLRMRFTCTVYRRIIDPDNIIKARRCGETDLPLLITQPAESFEVLNDLVVDRGAGPYMSLLELFGDDQHLTTVQADGLVIATPTGSTAYSVSAGGSLVHPAIPALLITPICPHTLSFRPMLLPDSMELRICVPYNSRSTAWVSFDGRGRVELKQGDHIKVTPSKFPFPTVCHESQSKDWFSSISRCLRWNERERQKSFVVVEEDNSEDEYNEDDDTSTKVSESSEQESLEYSEVKLQNTRGDHNLGSSSNNINVNKNNKQLHRNDHAFACLGKDGSDSSSNNSGGEEEWKVVTRKQNKKNIKKKYLDRK
ncbi:hypothetical protein Glove_718g44 [Diversispora epigaea]|uniref:NAD+ kinase n=1 Tax=Diversispora epigaea TaxID=1348612 RepID=A0A397G1H5_9GLOM|nr:hypothetical protein Glove_718g44 [Diversispora epigaea]